MVAEVKVLVVAGNIIDIFSVTCFLVSFVSTILYQWTQLPP